MSLISLIGTDCGDIIFGYKDDLEQYETLLEDIRECATSTHFYSCYILPIKLCDFKNYFLKHNLTNRIKFQMKIYGNKKDNTFYNLNLNELNDVKMKNVGIYRMRKFRKTIYLELLYETKTETNDCLSSDSGHNCDTINDVTRLYEGHIHICSKPDDCCMCNKWSNQKSKWQLNDKSRQFVPSVWDELV